MKDEIPLRFVTVRQAVYIRREDVAAYLRAMSATEETEVRERLELAASAIENTGTKQREQAQ